MTLAERHDFIMDLLQQQGSVSVAALAERLKVSEVTIRKDLTLLEEKKMLYRAHGSAILINPYINDRPVNEKEKHNAAEKRAIGIRAASLVTPDDSILIASGTTMLFLAREIKAQGRLTVITSAVNIVPILVRDHNVDVVQLGGMVRNTSVSAVGVYAERMLQDFSCSKLYLGVDGIDLEYGLSTTNLMEAGLNRAMIRTAQKTIVLADSSKFGRRGFSKICDLSDVDQIITDSNVSPHTLAQLRSQGIEVTVVEAVYPPCDRIENERRRFPRSVRNEGIVRSKRRSASRNESSFRGSAHRAHNIASDCLSLQSETSGRRRRHPTARPRPPTGSTYAPCPPSHRSFPTWRSSSSPPAVLRSSSRDCANPSSSATSWPACWQALRYRSSRPSPMRRASACGPTSASSSCFSPWDSNSRSANC